MGVIGAAGSAVPAPRTEPFDDLDRLSPEELAGWVASRCGDVLRVAAEELPFYRARFADAGFDAAAFRSLGDLAGVPVLRKTDVLAAQRRAGTDLGAVGIERLGPGAGRIVTMSSGTSGTTFLRWPREWRDLQGESSLRAHWWAGLRPGTPFLLVAPGWHVYAAVQSYLVERLGLPGVVVSGTFLPRFADRVVDALRTFRPRFQILFLPMVFSLLAEARRRGLTAGDVFGSVERLIVTGAPITPGMRAHLSRITGIPAVVELAGSTENLLAVECDRGDGLHVVPDTCHVEILDETEAAPVAPGRRGAVVHTTMVPWGSVYLRYDGGDVGVMDPAPCPCGLPSPRLKIVGRAENAFVLGTRTWLPYDVQAAVEEEIPDLAGVGFAVLREGLAANRLSLLFQAPEEGVRPAVERAVPAALRGRFDVEVDARWSTTLPLLFKGVTPLLSEREVGA